MAVQLKPTYQKIDLDPVFPFHSKTMYSSVGIDLIYCHWHPNIEIIHITKGSVLLQIDNQSIQYDEGDICIINPGKIHYGNPINNMKSTVHLSIISYDILPYNHDNHIYQRYIAPLERGDLLLPAKLANPESNIDMPDWQKQCHSILVNLISYGDKSFNGKELVVQGTFIELIAVLHANNGLIKSSMKIKNRISARDMSILEYVEDNFAEISNITDLANTFNLNEDYFYRLFKKNTGLTPVTFINQLRIRYAKQLLKTTDMSVSEIGYSVGFNSSSYFSRIFKRYSNLSPNAYRK